MISNVSEEYSFATQLNETADMLKSNNIFQGKWNIVPADLDSASAVLKLHYNHLMFLSMLIIYSLTILLRDSKTSIQRV